MAKRDEPLYLAVVGQISSHSEKQMKIMSVIAAASAQGMKRQKMKMECPKKDFKSFQERKQELI